MRVRIPGSRRWRAIFSPPARQRNPRIALAGDPRVQDAYSLRCMPQVHGAIRGALAHCEEILEIESGSATDNPLVFAENGDVLSGGNFHGAPLALALDYAAIALTDLMSISERRTDRLVNPDLNEGLPPFSPASRDAFRFHDLARRRRLAPKRSQSARAPRERGQSADLRREGRSCLHGNDGALKLRTIVENAENVIAIELLSGAEALEFRRPLKGGLGVERAFTALRSISPRVNEDRSLSPDIERVAAAIRNGEFDSEDERL